MSGIFKAIGDALSFGKPSADFKTVHIPHISTKDINLIFDVEIKNPNPIPIPLVDILYSVVINDKEFVSGKIPDAGTIGTHDSKLIQIGVDLVFKNVIETFEGLVPGSIVRYVLKAKFIIDIPVFGNFEIAVDHDGDFPIPIIPDIDLEEIDWVDLSFTETKAVAHVKVENLNKFTVMVKSFEYKLYLTDDLISEGKTEPESGLAEKAVTRLAIPFTFRPKDLGRAAWDIITGSQSGYTLAGKLVVDSPYGLIELPFSKGGSTSLKKEKGDPTVPPSAAEAEAETAAEVGDGETPDPY